MAADVFPQWIAKMYAGKKGRDHLGLGSVSSGQILHTLSPSINVLTFHPRYHSFYVFLLDEYWKRDIPRSFSTWKEFFRPRDFIFSLGANLCDQPEHGDMRTIVGGQKTGPLADEHRKSYSYDPNYIKRDLSGYGLYYRTVMAELGLIYPGGQGFPVPVDVPSEYGKKVAEAFRVAVADTTYFLEYFDKPTAAIPIKVIKEYIHKACLCQLQKTKAPDRDDVLDSFLHHGTKSQAKARRATFRLFLDIADQTKDNALNEDDFRQLIYFGETFERIRYNPSEIVRDTYLRWRLYQAREYYAFALNGLWFHLCDWGIQNRGDYRQVPLSDFWDYLDKGLDFRKLSKRLNLPDPKLKSTSRITELHGWLRNTLMKRGKDLDQSCTIHSPINEHILYKLALGNISEPEVMMAGMITLLALVFLRFSDPDLRKRPEWGIACMGEEQRLSMDLFLKKLNKKIQTTGITIAEITRWIYENDVILQHELVASSKLPENTFRFQRDGDSLRFQNLDNTIGFMNSRFDAINTTVSEFGLCGNLGLPNHKLTKDGKQILEKGDL